MVSSERAQIARRYLRSIRIDTDLTEKSSLDGFICTQSYYEVLNALILHVTQTNQGAFTWTGPYGSGKSSLVVALCSLLSTDRTLQSKAEGIFSKEFTHNFREALPLGSKGWRIVPVVGGYVDPIMAIGEAARKEKVIKRRPKGGWSEGNLIKALMEATNYKSNEYGGLVLFIDEMGKFLESAARNEYDIYIFQQLAELASRSQRRLLIVGILHQSFEEYTFRLSHEVRDEWAKIQGRFIDLVVNSTAEEQIELLSRAIANNQNPEGMAEICNIVSKYSFNDSQILSNKLIECWPLHPIVSCLLGPISSRRFGQNQRSLFGFLNSAEPYGFQDFLSHSSSSELYTPDMLWDYLQTNLEPSILSSRDAHRWALSAEALERCESQGGNEINIKLLKIISVMDLFKDRSRIGPNFDLLKTCFPDLPSNKLKGSLSKLNRDSFTIFKKFKGVHAIYAGSDFDIEKALNSALNEIDEIDFNKLQLLAGIQPIVAKRHYHETGALRWFDVEICPLKSLEKVLNHIEQKTEAVGKFILVIPTEGESEIEARNLCQEIANEIGSDRDVLLGLSKISWVITSLTRELLALELVNETYPELSGDPVARREVSSRIAEMKSLLESELYKSFDNAVWYNNSFEPNQIRQSELNNLASYLADKRFNKSPIIHNELLNRHKPSGSAIAAQKKLLSHMINNEGRLRLGIERFPAEAGLFISILEKSGLYRKKEQNWCFSSPDDCEDICRVNPLWKEAKKKLNRSTFSVLELFDLWRQPPFGVKDGLLPIFAVSFILTHRENLAVYREGVFKPNLDNVDIDYLIKDAGSIQLRWMEISGIARKLLLEMASIVNDLDENNKITNLEPIDVARGLVAIYDNLPQWTKRTMRISSNAVQIREMFKRAHDPNKFLFDDIPETFSVNPKDINDETVKKVANNIRDGLNELVSAYDSLLHRIRDVMFNELNVHNTSTQSISELQSRAQNILQIAGEYKLEAFINRISHFSNDNESIEGIASLAASKPSRQWTDLDFDRTLIEVAELSQKFLRTESFARVKGRADKRHSIAVIVGIDGKPTPVHDEFTITDSERQNVDSLIKEIDSMLGIENKYNRNIILTALAEVSAQYIKKSTENNNMTEHQVQVL